MDCFILLCYKSFCVWLPQWSNYSCPLVERSKSSFSVSREMLTLNFHQFNSTIKTIWVRLSILRMLFSFFANDNCGVEDILIVCQWRIAAEVSWYEGHATLSLLQFPFTIDFSDTFTTFPFNLFFSIKFLVISSAKVSNISAPDDVVLGHIQWAPSVQMKDRWTKIFIDIANPGQVGPIYQHQLCPWAQAL